MSRQDKATTERNARILRDLVKQPDNKACADCRKNDARWASWNIGCYLCIRCSGIHRSMGTHISRVKSIDLDIWTPEQMENIQRWGNRRANAYWERHLKKGHVPADHKMESFIRSKYESRRWAMEGPVPQDPSVLDEENGHAPMEQQQHQPKPTPTSSAPPAAPASLPRTHPLLSRQTPAKPAAAPAPTVAPIVDLFGDDDASSFAPMTTAPPAASRQSQPAGPQATTGVAPPGPTAAAAAQPAQPAQTAQAPPAPQPTSGSNIFDLDFRAPTSAKPQTAKADIMSLFSTPSPTGTGAQTQQGIQHQNNFGSWNGGITSSAAPPTLASPVGNHQVSTAGWGGMSMDQNAWGGAPSVPSSNSGGVGHNQYQQQPQSQQQQYQQQPMSAGTNAWGGQDPWASAGGNMSNGFGSSNGGGFGGVQAAAAVPKKEERDPFANIWS